MADESLLEAYVARHPGITVAAATVTPKGVETSYANCGEETRFEIGSITKVFTGILLCEAVQDRLCSFDTPLAEIFPQHAPKLLGRKITLRHLATHTSSLPRLPLAMVKTASSAQPYAALDRDKILRALAQTPVLRTPGSLYAYSNFGFAVLGAAIETLREKPYAELVTNLTARLGSPTIRLPNESDSAYAARGHDSKGNEIPSWDMAAFAPAGGLTSNLEGLIAFAQKSLSPLNAPALAESMTERTKVEKRTEDARHVWIALGMSALAGILACAEPGSFVPLAGIGLAAYLGGPTYGAAPTVAWGIASAAAGAPAYIVGERIGFGLVASGIAQNFRRKTTTQEMGIGWHVSKSPDGKELLWHNGGTSGFRSFLGIVPATGRSSVVLAASADSVDSVGLSLLRS